jgi:hypothetical protein
VQAADVALITNARRAPQPSTTTAGHLAGGSDQCGLSGAQLPDFILSEEGL